MNSYDEQEPPDGRHIFTGDRFDATRLLTIWAMNVERAIDKAAQLWGDLYYKKYLPMMRG